MNDEFISIIKKVIADRGKSIVNNLAVFNSLLADYAKGEYANDRRLFIRELKTKPFDEVMKKYQPEPPKPQPVIPPPIQPAVPPPVPSSPPIRNTPVPSNYNDDDDDDDDDDEFIAQPAKRKSGEEAYFIKCPRCGEVGEITDPRDIRSRHLGYVCPRCGNDFIIEFFGICQSCREKTGFNTHRLETIIAVAGSIILDALEDKPKGIISSIGDVIKESYPYGTSAGECTFCKQIHVECPN